MRGHPEHGNNTLMNGFRLLAVACILFAVTACSQELRKHGYLPPPEALAMVEPGKSTRDSVIETIGAPTSTGVLDESSFIYVTNYVRKYGFRAQQIVRRDAIVISFNQQGVVRNVERFDLQDGKAVVLERRVTDTGAGDNTFLRQLLSNLTNFNPALVTGQ